MPITEPYANFASIGTTEYSLPNNSTTGASITDDGVYQLFLDLSNLAAEDSYELKIYEKVISSGTKRVLQTQTFSNVQPTPNVVLPSLILLHGWDITLKKLAGTDRNIAWSIRKIA